MTQVIDPDVHLWPFVRKVEVSLVGSLFVADMYEATKYFTSLKELKQDTDLSFLKDLHWAWGNDYMSRHHWPTIVLMWEQKVPILIPPDFNEMGIYTFRAFAYLKIKSLWTKGGAVLKSYDEIWSFIDREWNPMLHEESVKKAERRPLKI